MYTCNGVISPQHRKLCKETIFTEHQLEWSEGHVFKCSIIHSGLHWDHWTIENRLEHAHIVRSALVNNSIVSSIFSKNVWNVYDIKLGYLQGRKCCGSNLPLFEVIEEWMTVDGLVNVQCGETFQKYDIDPIIDICLDKDISDNLLPFIILYYPKYT